MSLFSRANPPPRPAFIPPAAESPPPSPNTHTYTRVGCGADGCTAVVTFTVQHDQYPLGVNRYEIAEHDCPQEETPDVE